MFVYHNGKRISRSVGSKKAAEKVARDIEAQLTLGEFSLNKKRVETTFGEYAQKWLQFVESQTKGNDPAKKKSTVEEYRGILKLHVLPTFKDYKINNIKMVEVRDHLISKLDTLSKKRVKGIMSVMSNIFELALEDETVDINPASKVSKRLFPKNGKRKSVEKTEVFTPDEIELFLDTCERDFPQFYQFFFMAVRTGLRLGELLALQWEDIDFNSKYVLVSRSYRKGRTTDTKTGQTGRTDISDQLVVVLKDHLKVCKEDALKQGRGEVTGLVFDYGRLNRESYIQRLYGRILKKAGL